jgi:matrixin
MQSLVAIVASAAIFLGGGPGGNPAPGGRLEIRDSSEQVEPAAQTSRRIKWPRKTIEVAFSTSLMSPGTNIKPDSDVVGAARRALGRWSTLGNINFIVVWSAAGSVSPADAGDGISLITIADTNENAAFNSDATAGRTRVFFDPETGTIAEADISINPRPRTEEGAELQFSTDGTPGTYDLEATFTHEVGHLLGLDHSAVIGSTMQGRQAFNGTFGLPALTERTLSEDDRQKIRSLYGPKLKVGRIEGKLADNRTPGVLAPLTGVNVWAESVTTGKVVASDVSADDGSYKLEGLSPGQYRVMVSPRTEDGAIGPQNFRSFEVSNLVTVRPNDFSSLNYHLVPPQASALSPKMIGLNSELSTVPLPLEPGKRVKVYLAGDGVDQVPGTSITVNSPFFTVDPASLIREQLTAPFPVISVEVQVAPNAPFGDYTIRMQSNSGEIAFVPGAITIDPAAASPLSNPVDDSRFLLSQHFADLTGRTADPATIDKLALQLSQCGSRADCLRATRLDISTNMLVNELPTSVLFLNTMYSSLLGRRPKLAEFEADRAVLLNDKEGPERARAALATAFVQRQEFQKKYPLTMKPAEFVEAILATVAQANGVDLAAEKDSLIGLLDDPAAGRGAVVSRLATQAAIVDSQYNQTLVLFQYFTFLKRDPDDTGFAYWLNTMKNKPLRDAGAARVLVCSFLNSEEYQSRFGILTTHTPRECN